MTILGNVHCSLFNVQLSLEQTPGFLRISRTMNRRQFLFLTNPRKNTAELSCQQLYMRYLDSTLDGTTPQFLQEIEQRLSGVTSLRLMDSVWLSADELKPVASLLDAFRARGGLIEYKSPKP
jgi:hypothetical protein